VLIVAFRIVGAPEACHVCQVVEKCERVIIRL
jgi:hypothetical protein